MSEGELGVKSTPDYILVALDTSPYSTAALLSAAEVAAAFNLELRGIYVEDVNLLNLCGLPFGLEIGSFTAKPRRLEHARMERDFQIQAAMLRKTMADIAGRQRLSWSFKVVRGGVTNELLSAVSTAHMVSLGRVGTTPGKRTGSTAQAIVRNTQRPVIVQGPQKSLSGPFVVVYLGDESSDNAVKLAIQLAKQRGASIAISTLAEHRAQADAFIPEFTENGIEYKIYSMPLHAMTEILGQLEVGAVILPLSVATWLDGIRVTVVVTP